MKTSSEMTKSVLERKNAYEKKKNIIKKTSVVAFTLAVVCAAVVAASGKLGNTAKTQPQADLNKTVSAQSQTSDNAANSPVQFDIANNVSYSDYKEIISGEDNGESASYATPANGTVGMSCPLYRALKEYGDSVRYRIEIDFFKDKTELEKDSDEVKAEIERISNVLMKKYSIGLSVITFTDSSGNKTISVSHDGAEKELIENFPASSKYGYMLWLYTSGEQDDTGAPSVNNGGFVSADSVG